MTMTLWVFPGLEQGQRFEQFVERAEPSGKRNECLRSDEEVHFSDRKIAKLKTEPWRDVGIGMLFMGQGNIQPDRFGIHVCCATIGCFHDARAPAGHDNIVAVAIDLAS